MKNPVIERFAAEDLRSQVEKVLRGLGYPEPPLDLRSVRDLLSLDLQYYSSKDDSWLREKVSRVKIAGKQLFLRPTLLLDVVKRAKLSALWIPDHQRILIDAEVPELKHRWIEAHEIGHKLAPWHERFLFGDDAETLRQTCHETLEGEANFSAGHLIFLGDRFSTEAKDLPQSIESVKYLNKTFGNTITSTLWRMVEEAHRDLPLVGIVSKHPLRPGKDFDQLNPCRYCIESPAFKQRFSVSEPDLFAAVKSYCSWSTAGPLGSEVILLTDRNGKDHRFEFESFSNRYEVLSLGVYHSPVNATVPVL